MVRKRGTRCCVVNSNLKDSWGGHVRLSCKFARTLGMRYLETLLMRADFWEQIQS